MCAAEGTVWHSHVTIAELFLGVDRGVLTGAVAKLSHTQACCCNSLIVNGCTISQSRVHKPLQQIILHTPNDEAIDGAIRAAGVVVVIADAAAGVHGIHIRGGAGAQ